MTTETWSTNFISPRPTFWKILTLIDFLEQVIATLDLSTWWKHSVKNSPCKNEVLLNELLDRWKEGILKRNKSQLHHYQRGLIILEWTQASVKNSDINHNLSTGRKNTWNPTSPKSPASVTGILRRGLLLEIFTNKTLKGKVLTDDNSEHVWSLLGEEKNGAFLLGRIC